MDLRIAVSTLLCCLAACSGGDSPVDRQLSASRIQQQVGPAGGVLRGPGGTALEGFTLEIPAGALVQLVEIVVEPGADIPIPGSIAVSSAYQLRVEPDPGVLREAATFRVAIELTGARRSADLFIASRRSAEQPSAIPGSPRREGLAAEFGDYDAGTLSFAATIRSLSDLQLRQASVRRLQDDSIRLAQLGYGRLIDLTGSSLLEADDLFRQAQQADPFSSVANMFRALSRILLVLDDRTDSSAGIDSVGEALMRSGFDVSSRSLIDRVRTGLWPSRVLVPNGAPTVAEFVQVLRERLRPAIELALLDLDRVPTTVEFVVSLPGLLPLLPGDREIDVGDLLAFRALLDGVAFLIDHVDDYDLEVDAGVVAPRTGAQPSIRSLLDRYPDFGRLLSAPDQATIDSLRAALGDFRAAFVAIDGEVDAQSDDLVVFPGSLTAERGDQWQLNIDAIRRSLEDDTEEHLGFEDGSGSIAIRFGGPFQDGLVSPGQLVPQLFRFVPIAGTLPDPTAGGLFPRMTQDTAADLLNLANFHVAPVLTILADGAFGDWSAAAEALTPMDQIGDTGDTGLGEVDLQRVYLAVSVDTVALRIGLADGVIGFRPDRVTVYGFSIRSIGETGYGTPLVVEVLMTNSGPSVRVRLDGTTRTVPSAVGIRGSDLELTLDRFQLFDPDEPQLDRAVFAFAENLEIESGVQASDRTRPFIVRF